MGTRENFTFTFIIKYNMGLENYAKSYLSNSFITPKPKQKLICDPLVAKLF